MIKIVIDPATGNFCKVEIETPDQESESQAFKAYQALRNEIQQFTKRTTKIIRLERALGRLK